MPYSLILKEKSKHFQNQVLVLMTHTLNRRRERKLYLLCGQKMKKIMALFLLFFSGYWKPRLFSK
ncbi:hypothetical protein CXU13_01395 [Akkermansia muciniphila]|nr:hypothetical protein CXU12_12890 [Akkermansia muciniphila]PNC61289.1 hypothetical protein CXU13_01395 [Akkermansia muciniphila]